MSGVGGAGSSNNDKFLEMYKTAKKDGKISQEEAQGLVKESLKDGGLDKNEREAIFEMGRYSSENATFDPNKLKNFDGAALPEDVKTLFDMGKKNKLEENQANKEARSAAKNSTLTETIGNSTAETISDAVKGTLETARGLADKIGVRKYLTGSSIATAARGAQNKLGNWSHDYGISPEEQGKINKLLGSIQTVGKHKADKVFTFQEFDNIKCVGNALTAINHKADNKKWNIPNNEAVNVSEGNLQKWTGKQWDAINVKETKDLGKYTAGQEGKAMVIDAGHSYVFNGYDKDNNIKVIDPSAKGKDQNKILEKNNGALTLFVQGKGDGSKTEAADATRVIHGVDGMKPLPVDNGSKSESFAIRKALVFMADPSKSAQFDVFKGKVRDSIKSGMSDESIKDLKGFLAKNGMGAIDERDVRAMVGVLTANTAANPEMGNKTNLLDMFDWLNDKSPSGKLTEKQSRVMSSVEHSNISLENYFSTFSSPGEKAGDMAQILNAMIKSKCCC